MPESPSTTRAADPLAALTRYRPLVERALRDAVSRARVGLRPATAAANYLDGFHGQIEYHLGWRDVSFAPSSAPSGKLLRPALVLLACELAAGKAGADAATRDRRLQQALLASVSVELVHNFSLVHDDIEDGDEARRHRPTLWKLVGVPQAINTGDGIFALARSELWRLPEMGVAAQQVVELAALLDRTSLELCEGQYLDMRYEGRFDVTVALYMAMIERKTAALMACAMEMGARLGAPDGADCWQTLAQFGRALGLAFQLRDDLLGIWSAQELGKSAAGDIRRKKMSLPVIHALETARGADANTLRRIYAQQGNATEDEIADVLAILERTDAHARVRAALAEQGAAAHAALGTASVAAPSAQEPHFLLTALLNYVVSAAN